MSERYPMTPQGYQKLREELKRIKEVERPQNIRDLEEARATGTFRKTPNSMRPRKGRGSWSNGCASWRTSWPGPRSSIPPR